MATHRKRRFEPELEAHKAWLGLLQPVGVVVAPPALISNQVFPDKNIVDVQHALEAVVDRPKTLLSDPDPILTDFPAFASQVLGWEPGTLTGTPNGPPLPENLSVHLHDYGDTLRPDFAAIDHFESTLDAPKVVMLISVTESNADLDKPPTEGPRTGWYASPQARLERMLRDTNVPAGLLCNGSELRLVYAPRGESSGHVGFPVAEMCTVGGRPILSALHMLLSHERMFGADDGKRLPDLMAESRKYQSEVSTKLSEQVLKALWELLRGFQAADNIASGKVFHGLARTNPDEIYGGLLTVIMRLVFLLYAEDQGLMPQNEIWHRNYSIGGLYERLRQDAGRYPDTMEQRFGAWAGLLTTFRMVYDGGSHGDLQLPTRHGQLFNPDEYPFLEGRPPGVNRSRGETFEAPRVSDGILWRVLEGLLVLDGERLSYRALDVEQIGSVYESMMGFDVQTLPGRAVALRPEHIVVDLDELLAQPGSKRSKWLTDQADCSLTGKALKALKDATTLEDLLAALDRRLSPQTPRPLQPGALFLQPGEERRRSGSHYTPRELTAPIVQTTLQPVLERLGERPTPEQILDLKVCDPAMGSGAFLVEACRQLAQALVQAWELHDRTPSIPPDVDPLLHARRLVAQRCLFGVDKNPYAVNLAKLSIWLVTLARDHAFTFLDHAIKHGDALVGLSRSQITYFGWKEAKADNDLLLQGVGETLHAADDLRKAIHNFGEGDYDQRHAAWRDSDELLSPVRLIADLCTAAFFAGSKAAEREDFRRTWRNQVDQLESQPLYLDELAGHVEELRNGARGITPLHWEIEFPEVFGRENPGFDAIIGNPPFAGKNTLANANRAGYPDWLKQLHEGTHGNADLSAHFFRRAFNLLRQGGALGLIATNTISQGDTRSTGLAWICNHGGTIYSATRRLQWPGLAAVVVSVVHLIQGPWEGAHQLDGHPVPRITAFLFHGGGHDNPRVLAPNSEDSFQGVTVLGMGFTFDDTDTKGVATPIAEMERLITENPRNAERIFPFIGGSEINTSPTHSPHRYVINFGEMSEEQARQWPDLMAIVEEKVKPARLKDNRSSYRKYWWQFAERRSGLFRALEGLPSVLALSQTSKHHSIASLPSNYVFSHKVIIFPTSTYSAFCSLQNQAHELWARFFGSSLEDRPVYTPSDCFETFPFPPNWLGDPTLEEAGQRYYDFRAALMVRNNQGLTETYNRFHDPLEQDPEILKLRELHAEMDQAVLAAYGWDDIPTHCEFLLDYEIDEETWGNKKKPWRYRWPNHVHDEVLARLLELNQQRYEEELAAGLHAKKTSNKAGKKSNTKAWKTPDTQGSLLGLLGTPDKGDKQ